MEDIERRIASCFDGLLSQEFECFRDKVVVELKYRSVAGIRVDDETAVGQTSR